MSKWANVPERRRKQIFAFNTARAVDAEKAADLVTLLDAMPPGQVRNLLKNKTCAAILNKYGITGEDA